VSKDWDPTKTKKYASDEARRLAAYEDWLGGMNGPQLAEKYKYCDRHAALRAVHLVRKTFLEDAEEARAQATERIMGPLMAMRAQAMPGKMRHPETGEEIDRPGDPAAAAQYKGLEERLSKLHGLDMPVKTDITTDGEKITINVIPDWQQDS
jgi:hypothetical protein